MGGRRLTLNDACDVAIKLGGKCISKEFIKRKHPLKWECSKGHIRESSFESVRSSNTWCPKCAIDSQRIGINVAKDIAKLRGGECLSALYLNTRTPLIWKCFQGHEWSATLNNIKNYNSWCPFCPHKHQELCRKIAMELLGPPSASPRPDFLKTSKYPKGLKLDIYYPQYGLAIEIQGIQHDRYIEFFHNENPVNFTKQQE
ncbi:hypothetical protein Glove_212g215 [Diversispora epigaea]|uniref:Zinc-ribbon domain-containing protein n=1 Tax=Diversispora epigaea TaxID=1348612 RepID=A0A397IRV7_9GLOM|nr:hypothetical protein Glove_212g215 [Diversispora epigaea]